MASLEGYANVADRAAEAKISGAAVVGKAKITGVTVADFEDGHAFSSPVGFVQAERVRAARPHGERLELVRRLVRPRSCTTRARRERSGTRTASGEQKLPRRSGEVLSWGGNPQALPRRHTAPGAQPSYRSFKRPRFPRLLPPRLAPPPSPSGPPAAWPGRSARPGMAGPTATPTTGRRTSPAAPGCPPRVPPRRLPPEFLDAPGGGFRRRFGHRATCGGLEFWLTAPDARRRRRAGVARTRRKPTGARSRLVGSVLPTRQHHTPPQCPLVLRHLPRAPVVAVLRDCQRHRVRQVVL